MAEDLARLTKANTVIAVILMAILSAVLVWGLRKWELAPMFRTLALILLLTDVSYAILMVLIGIETIEIVEIDTQKKDWFLATGIGIFLFFFYFGGNLAHWLYSYRYWIVSREVPAMIRGNLFTLQEVQKKEKCYMIF